MSGLDESGSTRRQRSRWRRWLMDGLLLPPALLYVLIENLFWFGSVKLLREASRLTGLRALQRQLGRLPAAAVLPLFLVPEVLSHVGGIGATLLLVKGRFAAAIAVGVFVKGIAAILVVWIYQGAAPTLLSIRWFAWCHAKALIGRDWVLETVAPARRALIGTIRNSRSNVTRRFRAMRLRIAQRLGLRPR